MLIGGMAKTSLIDYPDKIAATIFTFGCNFRCSFCHNPNIVCGISRLIPKEKALAFLRSRGKLLEAVCLSGGEPTQQLDLVEFAKKIKELGLLVKLDTNGTNPEMLEKLIRQKLIDYAAMDIKAPWEKYAGVVCRQTDLEKIKKSVIILKQEKIGYEFRSTVLPLFHSKEDIIRMAEQVKGADKYYLQAFKSAPRLVNRNIEKEKSYSRRELNEIVEEIKGWFKVCEVR